MKPLRPLTLWDYIRLEIVDWMLNRILDVVPTKTNDGLLVVMHIHSLAAHRLKNTPVDALDWKKAER